MRKTECSCERCQSACRRTRGWFRPGEAEKVAAYLGITLPVLFKGFLGVNWWAAKQDVYVLAPATLSMEPGGMYPASPLGQCVFFKDGHCSIHKVKPFHCSHGNPCAFDEAYHKQATDRTVALWRKQQGQITKLLGEPPRSSFLSPLEAIFSGWM